VRLTADELCRAAGIDADFLASLHAYKLLAESDFYDRTAARIAAAAGLLAEHGIEPRHLRQIDAAAERELALVDAVIAPTARRSADAGAESRATELARACGQLHAALLLTKIPGRYR